MTLYETDSVKVDRDFARFGSKTYAINQINSVDVETDPPPRNIGALLLLIIGLLTLWGGFVSDGGPAPVALAIGVALIALAIWLNQRKRPSTHRLFLRTSSAEGAVYTTQDEDDLAALRGAIEAAMAGR